jgi:hydrogenase maturation protein HypF
MVKFEMCAPCAREYGDPQDRRFHAQPNACPDCGPQIQLCRPDRAVISGDPIREAASILRGGGIVAVKGIGGYHLACRADQEASVSELRRRKIRDGKPLAVMVPDIESARRACHLGHADVAALMSPTAPIVLAPKRCGPDLAESVAPGCGQFGVMVPYAPVHHLLFQEDPGPLVMTSANLAGQPLTYRDDDAFTALGQVADAFLIHNREICRPIDDSVVFTFRDEIVPIRRARGFAPGPIPVGLPQETPRILAVGGELKSTVCLLRPSEAVLSEHLGDLVHPQSYRSFVQAIERLRELFDFEPELVAHDLHPQYLSTGYARRLEAPLVTVQHHHAHIASVMAEWGESGPVIGLACDGAGYGPDGAVWGCEVLRCERGEYQRLGHLESFPLVGGDSAALETWRPAASLLRAALGEGWRERCRNLFRVVPDDFLEVFEQQAASGANSPPTSSLGRVFDAVAFLVGLCDRNRHEAEAAMALEAAAGTCPAEPFAYTVLEQDGVLIASPLPVMIEVLEALETGMPGERIAARFHETVAQMLAEAAETASNGMHVDVVALSGGCFCNRRLLARLVGLLEARSLRVLLNRRVPCGDGGLSLGQAAVAAWQSLSTMKES